ncbi:MAG: glycosyltransferase family 4 protein [Bacillota bacterium]
MKISILHIVGDSKFGGGSVLVNRLATMAKNQGWKADVLTTDYSFQQVLRNTGIGVISLDCIWRETRPIRDLAGLFRLSAFLRDRRYTIVHTHTSKAGFIGRLAARLARLPVVVHTVHGFAFHEESSRLQLGMYGALERLAASAADRVVTVSHYHRDWALKLGIGLPEKVVAIPNGIAPERVITSGSREQARLELGLTPRDYALLSTGRLAPQKGLEFLLSAIALLEEQELPPFRLFLAGTGPLSETLEKKVQDLKIEPRVRFLGFRNDVGALLQAADMVVLPSLWEGLSIALLEAMAAGKPIVTTSIGSNLEATGGGEAAVLVPPKDSGALAEAIRGLILDSAKAELLGEAARKRFVEQYTEDKMLSAYLELYNQLLAEKVHK